MTLRQKRCAEQLTSLFENGTTEIQYAYAEKLRDGRGLTLGRAGFTTATGDACEVIELYTTQKSDNVLASYLPRLRELAQIESASLKGLKGFAENWRRAAAEDSLFRSVQDTIVDRLYYKPSVRYSNKLKLKTALARAVIFDTIIQHGDGGDPDGLRALIERTKIEAGGTPRDGANEKIWLKTFLKVRRADLACAFSDTTRKVWADSVERCDVFLRIAATGNYDLRTPFEVVWENEKFIISG